MPNTLSFLGASVLGMNSRIGWNGSPSEVKVDLVVDPTVGDSFNPHGIGGAVSLTLGSLSFTGLLKKYTKDTSDRGETYSVYLTDPRHLLDGSKLIISDYNRTTTGIYQLFNVFGYYENALGFGGAQANSTGMPWEMVRDGLLAICNGGIYTSFGGPITYRGFKYTLNLTELPPLPSYFRVGGYSHGMSILDFIQICCDTANYDYFIKLVGTVITLKTIPRLNAYPLGTIATMITSTFPNRVIRSSVGVEERAETTSTFVIGGDVHTLYQAQPLPNFESSFWGFYPVTVDDTDPDNLRPIIGSVDQAQRYANFYSDPVNSIYSYPVKRYRIYIDSPTIAGYTGATFYITNDLELQIILGIGQNRNSFSSWQRYLHVANNSMYQQLNLTNTPPNIFQPTATAPALPNNAVNTGRAAVTANTAARTGSLIEMGAFRLKAVYDFLSNYARNYYGRKWAIHIPDVVRKIDTDSGKIGYSHEIADGGWVDILDSNDLSGLPVEAYHRFQTQDGRFQSFTTFEGSTIDISRVNKANSYQRPSGSLYAKITIDNQLYFDASGFAYAIIDTDPVYDYPNSIVGLSGVVGALYLSSGISIESFEGISTPSGVNYLRGLLNNGAQNSTPLVTHPKPRQPEEFQIAIKSNILTYGPWYAQGASGHIDYRQDQSLVPWNYGGYTNLDFAGNAQAADGISNIQVIEAGYVEVEGLPEYNMGDIIVANGPNITDISVDLRKEGYTTTYRFETYVPRPGQLGKYNIDRIKRLNIASIEMNRKIRNRAELFQVQGAAAQEAVAGNLPFQRLFHRGIVQDSPANMIVSRVISPSNGVKFPVISFAKLDEVAGLVPSGVSDYHSFAAASSESIFSPYSIYASSGNTDLPRQSMIMNIDPTGIITAANLTPWINTSSSGYTCKYYGKTGSEGYEDINDYNWTTNPASSGVPKQVIGMRAPLVLAGWGYDLQGNVTPSNETRLTDVSTHKVGPVDLLWDDYRKVWTPHDILKGVTEQSIAAGSTGVVGLYRNLTDTAVNFNVTNWSDSNIASGTKILFGYNAHDNKWYAINSSSGTSQSSSTTRITATNTTASGPDFRFAPSDNSMSIITDSTSGVYFNASPIYYGYIGSGIPSFGYPTSQYQSTIYTPGGVVTPAASAIDGPNALLNWDGLYKTKQLFYNEGGTYKFIPQQGIVSETDANIYFAWSNASLIGMMRSVDVFAEPNTIFVRKFEVNGINGFYFRGLMASSGTHAGESVPGISIDYTDGAGGYIQRAGVSNNNLSGLEFTSGLLTGGSIDFAGQSVAPSQLSSAVTLTKGGTGSDLSATGPGILVQATTGANVTVLQESDSGALTDSSGGSADGTVSAVSGTGDDTTINDNFADLTAKYNALRTALQNLGAMA